MKLYTPRQDHTGDRQLDVIQRESKRVANRTNACPFLSGVLRTVRLVGSTPKTVDHGLGTRCAFLTVRPNYDGTGTVTGVVEAPTANQNAIDINNQLSVIANADCLVDLWFYPIASEALPR